MQWRQCLARKKKSARGLRVRSEETRGTMFFRASLALGSDHGDP